MPLINQKELIQGCIDRDIKSQKAIYTFYSRKMMGVCMRYASCVNEAKDFMQESFIFRNNASEGGGIHCQTNEAATVFIDSDNEIVSGLQQNRATLNHGGGAWIGAGCTFTSVSGESPIDDVIDIKGIFGK